MIFIWTKRSRNRADLTESNTSPWQRYQQNLQSDDFSHDPAQEQVRLEADIDVAADQDERQANDQSPERRVGVEYVQQVLRGPEDRVRDPCPEPHYEHQEPDEVIA